MRPCREASIDSASRTSRTGSAPSSPRVSARSSGWSRPSCTIRICSSSTSQRRRSTPTSPSRCAPACWRCAPSGARRCSSPATTCARWRCSPNASCSSPAVESWPTRPRRRSRPSTGTRTSSACSSTSPSSTADERRSPMNTRRTWWVIRRHAYVLWRSPHRWFDIAFWPFMDIVLWGSLGAFVARQDETSRAATPFLVGGILMFHILFQSQIAVATGFMEETWSRNLLNVMTTPVTEVEYIVGTAAFGLAKVLAALATLSVSALLFFDFSLDSIGWAMVPIGLVLVLLGWAIGIINVGLLLRYGQSAEILAWGMNYVLLACSGVFNPVEALPAAFQPIARLLPSTHAFSALRTVLDGDPLPVDEIVIGVIESIVWLAGAIVFAVWMLRVFRRRGFVTRFS